jgi:hypothetical protein
VRSKKAFFRRFHGSLQRRVFFSLPLAVLSNLPTSCYDLKFAEIIGNGSPINLREMASPNAPLLLDPKAKRVKEIAQMFGSKMRPLLR